MEAIASRLGAIASSLPESPHGAAGTTTTPTRAQQAQLQSLNGARVEPGTTPALKSMKLPCLQTRPNAPRLELHLA